MTTPEKRPTDVSVVLGYLVKLDDFASREMILQDTSLPANRLRAAIAHLMRHHAIDAMIVNGSELWFYATPAEDTRTAIRKESPNNAHRNDKGRRSPKERIPLVERIKRSKAL